MAVQIPPNPPRKGAPRAGVSTPFSRRALLGAAGVAIAGVAGCTDKSTPSSQSSDIHLQLKSGPTIIPDGSPAQVSVAVSRALVASSRAVVVAATADAAQAWKPTLSLGVPLLLIDDAGQPASGSGTTSAQTSTAAAAEEIRRLKASAVLAVGSGAQKFGETLDGISVHDSAAAMPDIAKVAAPAGSVLLTLLGVPAADATEADPAVVAAAATAVAIGMLAITAPGGDPRNGSVTVDAIARAKPTRVVAVGSAFGTPELLSPRLATAATGVQLPGGGQVIAGKLYVALYGHPGTPLLGILGEESVDQAVTVSGDYAKPYRKLTPRPVVPTFELITTVATSGAGPDSNFSKEWDPGLFMPWIERAAREGIYVILDLQPGTSRLLEQAQLYPDLLRHPHVGLALDPEWKLVPGQRPLSQIGQVSAEEINEVGDWLADLVRQARLPQKAFVLHQFQTRMITDRNTLRFHDELQTIVHVDGSGAPGDKLRTYAAVTADAPPQILWGWKNFIDEDSPMFTPERTMTVVPTPTMISYQ